MSRSYKTQLREELNEDDPDRRLQVCEIMDRIILENPAIVNHIVGVIK